MRRASAAFGGVLVLAVVAAVLTEATMALGHRGGLTNDTLLRPPATPTPAATASPTPTPSVIPSPTPTPAATPASSTATTNSFVRLRAGKSTATAVLAELNGGTAVQLLPDSDAQWQQVSVGGRTGYIFKSYLTY